MPRASSIDRLPEDVQALIGTLRQRGWTIDQIHAHLTDLLDKAPSRSAVGRHVKGLAQLGERLRRSRQVAEALVEQLGDAPESRSNRLALEVCHSAILDLFMRADDAEVGEAGGAGPVGDAETAMLAKALDHLASARKKDADTTLRLKKEFAAELEKKLDQVQGEASREQMTPAQALERVRALYRGEG